MVPGRFIFPSTEGTGFCSSAPAAPAEPAGNQREEHQNSCYGGEIKHAGFSVLPGCDHILQQLESSGIAPVAGTDDFITHDAFAVQNVGFGKLVGTILR